MDPASAIGAALLLAGILLTFVGALGLLRFPDFYTRLHAAGITDTLGAGLFLAGLALEFGASLASLKLGMVFLFLLFTGPTACHALAKSAWRNGLVPWSADRVHAGEVPPPARRRARRGRRR